MDQNTQMPAATDDQTHMPEGEAHEEAPMTPAPEGETHEAPVAEPTAPMGTGMPAQAPAMTPGADSAPAAEGEEEVHPMDAAATPAEATATEAPEEQPVA